MSAQPYHKRYHSDALSGFMALNLEERGAYQTLLDMMYDHGGPILDNERLLAGYMQVSVRKWRSLRETLLAKGKIYTSEDGLIGNERVDLEIKKYLKTSRKHAENGLKGARKKAENAKKPNENNEGDEAGLEQNSGLYQKPEAIDSGSNEPAVPATLSERLWSDGLAFLQRAGMPESRARPQMGKWRKALGGADGGDAKLLALIADCEAKAISDPNAYIEQAVRKFAKPQDERQRFLEMNYGANAQRGPRVPIPDEEEL